MVRWNCQNCRAIVDFSEICSACTKCWNCVRKCTGNRCIECCEEPVLQMKCIWETRFKPHINKLLEMEDGQYLALIGICHACEHAYKTLVRDGRNVMQDALEATLRLHDFLSFAARNGQNLDKSGEPHKHWGKVRARVLRDVILNPTKHEGRLREGTEFVCDPNAFASSHLTSMTPEESAILEAGGTVRVEVSRLRENAYFSIRHLMNGIDEAYFSFQNDDQVHEWYSPSTCGDNCDICRKAMMLEGIDVSSKPANEEDRIRRQVRTEKATGRFYLSANDDPLGVGCGKNPVPQYGGNLSPILVHFCESVVSDLQRKYREVKQENDKFNEPTPKLEIVLPNGEMQTMN